MKRFVIVAVVAVCGISARSTMAATELNEGVIIRRGGDVLIDKWAAGSQVSTNSAPAIGGDAIYLIGGDEYANVEYAHVFTSTGSCTFTAPMDEDVTVGYFIVGGGGSGGYGKGSGGGAGGVRFGSFRLAAGEQVTVMVGAGGQHATSATAGGSGGDSSVIVGDIHLVALGGGAGGGFADGIFSADSGGSGGGGEQGKSVDGLQGTDGGAVSSWNTTSGGGGAGRAGETGTDNPTKIAGRGGDGVRCAITGEMIWYAGGGGGGAATQNGAPNPGDGGLGGGGRGATKERNDPVAGTDGLGGGGGGGCYNGRWNPGADGGSGVVIFRYVKPQNGLILMLK